MFYKCFISNDASVFQSIHTFVYAEIYTPLVIYQGGKIIQVNEILRYYSNGWPHKFRIREDVVEVNMLNVGS